MYFLFFFRQLPIAAACTVIITLKFRQQIFKFRKNEHNFDFCRFQKKTKVGIFFFFCKLELFIYAWSLEACVFFIFFSSASHLTSAHGVITVSWQLEELSTLTTDTKHITMLRVSILCPTHKKNVRIVQRSY